MSANDQLLVKKYGKKWYVFSVMAESWDETNTIHVGQAIKSFKTKGDAFVFADNYEIHNDYPTEYGISTRLIKDGAEVKIVK